MEKQQNWKVIGMNTNLKLKLEFDDKNISFSTTKSATPYVICTPNSLGDADVEIHRDEVSLLYQVSRLLSCQYLDDKYLLPDGYRFNVYKKVPVPETELFMWDDKHHGMVQMKRFDTYEYAGKVNVYYKFEE